MQLSVKQILDSYDPNLPLDRAETISGPWYTDERIAELERKHVFGATWQLIGRAAQGEQPGDFLTGEVAGEPLLVSRGKDGVLRAFYNVCRHHAAAVETRTCGNAKLFRCPYHGWSYSTEGELKSVTEFQGVCDFDYAKNGLVPLRVEAWEKFVFVNLNE